MNRRNSVTRSLSVLATVLLLAGCTKETYCNMSIDDARKARETVERCNEMPSCEVTIRAVRILAEQEEKVRYWCDES